MTNPSVSLEALHASFGLPAPVAPVTAAGAEGAAWLSKPVALKRTSAQKLTLPSLRPSSQEPSLPSWSLTP